MSRTPRKPPAREVTVADLSRDPAKVVAGLAATQRGDHAQGVALALAACGRELHARNHMLWTWVTMNDGGDAVWILPVSASQAAAYAPRGPAGVLLRSIRASVIAGALPEGTRVLDWLGRVAIEAPGVDPDPELAQIALDEYHPDAVAVKVRWLDPRYYGDPDPIALDPVTAQHDDLAKLALGIRVHPLEVALALWEHGVDPEQAVNDENTRATLRAWGVAGEPVPRPSGTRSLAVLDDPCPRRRHARRVLQRMFRMRKIGPNNHTAFDHMYRGAPPEHRKDALDLGEALIRAGLLGEKPSVGQRHVYLRREALPAIHALIDRGETSNPDLATLWSAPAP